MTNKVAVVTFPGSNCEQDVVHALKLVGAQPQYVWHLETSLDGFDAVVLPGGFAYGDYLRTGAIAAFSPVMGAVKRFAASGGPVLGICNGFQILCEAGLLPGALRRNSGLKFKCVPVHIKLAAGSMFTPGADPGVVLQIPINHFEGNYYCPDETLQSLHERGRVAFQYCDARGNVTAESNPNGASDGIAGVCSEKGNVLGMMPHPERAIDPEIGGTDGRMIIESLASVGATV